MDLGKFDLSQTESVMQVFHPDDDTVLTDEKTKEELTITLLSVDTKEFKARESTLAKRHMRRRSRVSVDELQTDRAVAATKAWSPGFQLDGQDDLECTPANVRALYDRCPWLRDDVINHINDRANYQGKS